MQHFFVRGPIALFGRISFLWALFVLAATAKAEEQVAKAPPGNWIEIVSVPEADPTRAAEIRNGVSYLLSDVQIRHEPDGFSHFDRLVYKIVDRPGLERGARIDLEFDPARHRVVLNRLQIIREGVVLDRLEEARVEIFRRETDSERGMFDGRLTAHINLNDVRVGDIVDYATTYETTPIVGENLLFTRFSVEWGEPVALIREKIIWPTGQPLGLRPVKTSAEPVISVGTDFTTYQWDIPNPAPVKPQEDLPVDYPRFGFVEISSAPGWQTVADAVLRYYEPADRFPAAFEARLDEIETRHAGPEERLVTALRLVQDEIRYVSLSIGTGSYVPRRPDAVLASGFGDCKDKALLLTSVLHRLGIEAQVALTDIDEGKALEHMLPGLQAFDHAIVKARIGDRTFWLDATDYLQGGRAVALAVPDYAFALPLVASGADLERIPRKDDLKPSQAISERFAFPKQDGGALVLTVDTIYRDAAADNMRRQLASQSKAKIADDYIRYYNTRYPGIKSTAMLQVTDDRDANILTVDEAYELPAEALAANDLAKNFRLKADIGIADLPTPSSAGRTAPIALGSAVYRSHKVTVTNLKARFSISKDADVQNPYLSLKVHWSNTPSEFETEWQFKTSGGDVPVDAIPNYLEAVTKISNNSEWEFNFTFSNAPAALSTLQIATGFGILIPLLFFLTALVREAFRQPLDDGRQYWPIPIPKFVILSLLTSGLYVYLWAWRAFRQQRLFHGARTWPFWRAMFLPIWFFPAFAAVNRKLATRSLPLWLGIAAAAILIIIWVAGILDSVYGAANSNVWLDIGQIVGASLAPLPLVLAINRLNENSPDLLRKGYTRWEIVAIAVGIVFSSSLIYTLSLPTNV